MNNVIKVLIVLSVAANGFMGGLIAGHVTRHGGLRPCKECECKHNRREEGPFPTGWIKPDDKPPKGDVR